LLIVAGVHYVRERAILAEQVEFMATQLGSMMLSGLRHAMITSDFEMINQIVADVGGLENVEKVQVVGFNHRILASSDELDLNVMGEINEQETAECRICHEAAEDVRPRAGHLPGEDDLIRLATPIKNGPECAQCHSEDEDTLGVILVDMSLVDVESFALRDLRLDLVASIIAMLIVVLVIYQLVNRLILRRIELFHHPLDAFAAGDFSARMPLDPTSSDELHQVGYAFNQMMDQLETHIREKEELNELRRSAIVEERNRIARELHDGLAQVLTYINTKTTAARLMITNSKEQAAVNHLLQLEEASQDLYVEVRAAILGLKVSSRIGQGLDQSLHYFAMQFSQLSDIPVDVVTPEKCEFSWDAEIEVQLLRIAQEALANTRKHALATQAWIHLQRNHDHLEMVIGDNGVGFKAEELPADNGLHFGLGSMKERANSIGATLLIHSEPGNGTQVRVHLSLPEKQA
jgi:signal transduction histidine kinase